MRRGISQVARLKLCALKVKDIVNPQIYVRLSGRQMLAIDDAVSAVLSVTRSRDIKNKVEYHLDRFCSAIAASPVLIIIDTIKVNPGAVEIPMTLKQMEILHENCVKAKDTKIRVGKDLDAAIKNLYNGIMAARAKKAQNRQL